MRPRRGNTILAALGVGAVFIAGLAVHGAVGGVLLLLVAATLVLVSRGTRGRGRGAGGSLRGVVLAAVVVLAVLKLAGRL